MIADSTYRHFSPFQLFAAGDTISVLNSKTAQLQEIVQTLQGSFDEIAKLVEGVKVGEKGGGRAEGEGKGEGEGEKEVEGGG